MNFSLRAMIYSTAIVATAIAGFGVGGLFLAATCLAIWRLALPGERPLPHKVEWFLAYYVIISLGLVLVVAGLCGLTGWSFDPAEYDLAPQICKWLFVALAVLPAYWWMQAEPSRHANVSEQDEVELPTDFQ